MYMIQQKKLESLLKEDILSQRRRKIILSGIGMGSTDGMTREAYYAFEDAEVIFGAERMLEIARQRCKSTLLSRG